MYYCCRHYGAKGLLHVLIKINISNILYYVEWGEQTNLNEYVNKPGHTTQDNQGYL